MYRGLFRHGSHVWYVPPPLGVPLWVNINLWVCYYNINVRGGAVRVDFAPDGVMGKVRKG